MLMQIHISNLITIKDLTLDFSNGTTVITGETGAGKSILIDAIEIGLGGRASEQIIRPESDKADISLCFDLSKLIEARAWLKNYDLDQEGGECIIRRTISRDGRSKSYINGMPTTLHPLRELSEFLINIHGQHEHQTLLKSEKQRDILDRYAGHQQLVDKVHAFADEWHAINNEMQQLMKVSEEREKQIHFLKFQLDELAALNLTPNEFEHLDSEHKQLSNADELLKNLNDSLQVLTECEENNAISFLHRSLQSLENIQSVDEKITPWIENLKNAIILISDTEHELHKYLNSIDLDPKRLVSVEQRISSLFNIARKHKVSPNELFEFQQNITNELIALENSDERLSQMQQRLKDLENKYESVANQLTKSRKKMAAKLSREITNTIQQLALANAEFQISLESKLTHELSPHGLEKIIFQIKTNAGQALQPLAKIASGGELSRISLAIHMATCEQYTIPTLIFDEVDVGVSGGTAEIVGKLLRQLGATHQVFCITHLPQVAAKGHQHIYVEKKTSNQLTQTHIRELNSAEKIKEIARLLGGVQITKTTLKHAEEMIKTT